MVFLLENYILGLFYNSVKNVNVRGRCCSSVMWLDVHQLVGHTAMCARRYSIVNCFLWSWKERLGIRCMHVCGGSEK